MRRTIWALVGLLASVILVLGILLGLAIGDVFATILLHIVGAFSG